MYIFHTPPSFPNRRFHTPSVCIMIGKPGNALPILRVLRSPSGCLVRAHCSQEVSIQPLFYIWAYFQSEIRRGNGVVSTNHFYTPANRVEFNRPEFNTLNINCKEIIFFRLNKTKNKCVQLPFLTSSTVEKIVSGVLLSCDWSTSCWQPAWRWSDLMLAFCWEFVLKTRSMSKNNALVAFDEWK